MTIVVRHRAQCRRRSWPNLYKLVKVVEVRGRHAPADASTATWR